MVSGDPRPRRNPGGPGSAPRGAVQAGPRARRPYCRSRRTAPGARPTRAPPRPPRHRHRPRQPAGASGSPDAPRLVARPCGAPSVPLSPPLRAALRPFACPSAPSRSRSRRSSPSPRCSRPCPRRRARPAARRGRGEASGSPSAAWPPGRGHDDAAPSGRDAAHDGRTAELQPGRASRGRRHHGPRGGRERRGRRHARRRHPPHRLCARDRTSRTARTSIRRYKVKSGDTLVTDREPLRRLDDDPVVGEQAQVQGRPPRRPGPADPAGLGLVVTVSDTDTLDSIAAKYSIKRRQDRRAQRPRGPDARRRPGARPAGRQGRPDPDPEAHPQAGGEGSGRERWRRLEASAASLEAEAHLPRRPFRWPVIGGGNYVSQGFHYGHCAIDIAADYGAPSSPRRGRVMFAGWKSNGGRCRSGSRTAAASTPRTTTCRASRWATASVGARPACRPARRERQRQRAAPALRGLAGRHALERRQPGQPDALLLAPDRAGRPPPRPSERSEPGPCDNQPDVPR